MSDDVKTGSGGSPPPLGREDLRRRKSIQGTGEPPEQLRKIILHPRVASYQLNAIGRESLARLSPQPLPPHRPDWASASPRPERILISGQPRQKLWHHGTEVEPLFVWGADDRQVYSDTTYPWGCVCRVVTAVGQGSGVIVGPRHVLTASHAVDWNANGSGTVEVHRAGAAVSAITPITRVWAFTKVTGSDVGYSEVDEDYAVLVTADRIGDAFGSMGVRTYDSGWDDEPWWFNIGYPGDVASGMFPIFQRDKELDEDEWDYGSARSMTTSADTAKGQSGGPLFGFWDDGPYVVAVVSAQGTFVLSGDENWCAGGNDLTRLVSHAIAADP